MLENWNQYEGLEYYPWVCECGCNGRINVQPWHKYRKSFPVYINGHGKIGKGSIQQWVKDMKVLLGDIFCVCGCGGKIEIRSHHKYTGIPEFLPGHNGKGKYTVPRETRTCADLDCTTTFKVRVSSTQKFCSTECQLKAAHEGARKPCSKEKAEKISDSISKVYLEGFRPKTFYEDGWVITKTGEEVYCRSSYEREAVNMLNSFEDVAIVKTEALRIPYKVNGVRHYYLPDFLVSTMDGGLFLIEVKPEYEIEERINQVKFEAGIRYARKHNMTYLIWTESILFSNKNGSTTAFLQEIVEATAATLSRDGKVMIQSELYSNIERQEETTCPLVKAS